MTVGAWSMAVVLWQQYEYYYYYTYTVQWSENVDPERSIALSTQALYTVFTVPNTIIIINNFIWWHRFIMTALKIQEQDQSSLHR